MRTIQHGRLNWWIRSGIALLAASVFMLAVLMIAAGFGAGTQVIPAAVLLAYWGARLSVALIIAGAVVAAVRWSR